MRWPDRRGKEALTACSVALLTIYDMCKAIDRGMTVSGLRLMEKRGEERALYGAACSK